MPSIVSSNVEIQQTDILMGKGPCISDHPGNCAYRRLIRRYAPLYFDGTLSLPEIEEVIRKDTKGRFLNVRVREGQHMNVSLSTKKQIRNRLRKALRRHARPNPTMTHPRMPLIFPPITDKCDARPEEAASGEAGKDRDLSLIHI